MKAKNLIAKADIDPVKLEIPEEHKDKDIRFTVTVKLPDEGWYYTADHIAVLSQRPTAVYMGEDAPLNCLIGNGQELIGKRFLLTSHFELVRSGSEEDTPSTVEYTLTFYADDVELNTSKRVKGPALQVNFRTDIIFA